MNARQHRKCVGRRKQPVSLVTKVAASIGKAGPFSSLAVHCRKFSCSLKDHGTLHCVTVFGSRIARFGGPHSGKNIFSAFPDTGTGPSTDTVGDYSLSPAFTERAVARVRVIFH